MLLLLFPLFPSSSSSLSCYSCPLPSDSLWRFLLLRNHGHGNGQVLLSNNKSDGRERLMAWFNNGNATKIILLHTLLAVTFCFLSLSLSSPRLVSADSSGSFIWFLFLFEVNTRTRAILLPSTWPTPRCSPNHQPLSIDDDRPDRHQSFLLLTNLTR